MKDYRAELDKLTALAKQAIAANIDIEFLKDHLEHLDVLAPMIAPTEWMNGGASNLDQQRLLIYGVAPFLKAVASLRQTAADEFRNKLRGILGEEAARLAYIPGDMSNPDEPSGTPAGLPNNSVSTKEK